MRRDRFAPAYDKDYFRMFFKRWQSKWGSCHQNFAFVRMGARKWEIHFPDERPDIYFKGLSELWAKPDLARGLVIRSWRMSLGYKQKDMAILLGIDASNLCAIERGHRTTGLALRRKIAREIKKHVTAGQNSFKIKNKIDGQNQIIYPTIVPAVARRNSVIDS